MYMPAAAYCPVNPLVHGVGPGGPLVHWHINIPRHFIRRYPAVLTTKRTSSLLEESQVLFLSCHLRLPVTSYDFNPGKRLPPLCMMPPATGTRCRCWACGRGCRIQTPPLAGTATRHGTSGGVVVQYDTYVAGSTSSTRTESPMASAMALNAAPASAAYIVLGSTSSTVPPTASSTLT